ncbi:hypothetical protein GmHk_15G043882 [Glycine max]|nr:hypothetical protein GmHk_15G043882 [Glycine max]
MEKMICNNDHRVQGDWSLIWNLQILPKAKHFLWLTLRGCLPTRTRLQQKKEKINYHMNLIFNLLDSLPVDNRCVFAITLWCIWKCKNDKIWKERNPSPSVSFSQAMQFLFEWSKARGFNDNETQPVRTNGSNTCTWKKSDHNFVKLNVDVAIFKQQYVHGAGIIQWLKLGLLCKPFNG